MWRWLGGDRETLTGQGFRKVKLQDIYTRPDIQRVVVGILDSLAQGDPSCSLTQQLGADKSLQRRLHLPRTGW